MIITDLKVQKRDSERFNVYLDGTYYCVLSAEAIVKNQLKIGAAVSREQIDSLQLETEKAQAINKTIKHLGGRLKTKKQVRDYLKTKGYVPAVINEVLDKLNEYSFIDDEQYAQEYIRCSAKNKGKRRIENELKQKGVAEELIKQKTADIENEFESALELAKKYMKNKELSRENSAKLYRYLSYRGFASGDIIKVIKKVSGEEYESGD
jgi:regulatory protein